MGKRTYLWGGNRKFQLSELENIITVEEGYYDLPPGGVIPSGTDLVLTYSVDMSSESLFNGDSVRIILKDKWTNYIQGFEEISVYDDNLEARFSANCNNEICSVEVDLKGPFPYFLPLYNWEYKNSDGFWVVEGGALGIYGKYRARYLTPNEQFDWVDFEFPMDIFQESYPYEPEEMPISGCINPSACNYNSEAVINDNSCKEMDCFNECGGSAVLDECGICNGNNSTCSIPGCTDEIACNYDSNATIEDSSCTYPDSENVDCNGNCIVDIDCNDECGGDDQSCLHIDQKSPTKFEISSVYPNPFNPKCEFRILNPKIQKVDISVLNLKGQLLKKLFYGNMHAGTHLFSWNGQFFNSGIYLIEIRYGSEIKVLRATLIK